MGMIWNTEATLDMIRRVNLEFFGDTDIAAADSPHGTVPPVAYWQSRRAEFQSTKDLKDIATDHGVVSPTQNANWMTWLSSFGDHTDSTTAHEKLRKAIHKGLDVTKYAEIVFSITPI